jgi:hypothetical protein
MLIEDKDRGTGNAVDLVPHEGGIAQSEPVDDRAARIREKRQRNSASPVAGDLPDQLPALLRRVFADRIDMHIPVDAGKIAEPDNLPDAIRSPVAAVEDEDDLLATSGGEADRLAVLVGEREVGSHLPRRRRQHLRRRSEEQARAKRGDDRESYVSEHRRIVTHSTAAPHLPPINLRSFTRMSDETPGSSIVLYQTEDGRTRIQCRLEDETIWLTQAQIAELFQVTPQNVTLHLKAIFADGELSESATCKDYLQVRREGAGKFPGPSDTIDSKPSLPLATASEARTALSSGRGPRPHSANTL